MRTTKKLKIWKLSKNVYLGIPYLSPKTAYQSDATAQNNLVLSLKGIIKIKYF
jgi:hypothetical protein